jgi:hypothetical protein
MCKLLGRRNFKNEASSILHETGEDYIMRSFITYTLHEIQFRVIESRRMNWTGHSRYEKCIQKFLSENFKG